MEGRDRLSSSPLHPRDTGPDTQQARGIVWAPTQLWKSVPTKGPAAASCRCGCYMSSFPREKGQNILYPSCLEAVVETQCFVLLELKDKVEISCQIKLHELVLHQHTGSAGCSQFMGPGFLFEVLKSSGTRQSCWLHNMVNTLNCYY